MKYYHVLASDIKLNVDRFKFGNYELIPVEHLKSGKHDLIRLENLEQYAPHPILLVFESESMPTTGHHVKYVSSLLSFVTRRRVRFCTFGGTAFQLGYPNNGNIGFLPSSCREIFGTEIQISNPKPFYEYAPDDEKAILELLKKIHEKIMTYPDDQKNTILDSLYIFQLSTMLENESPDLAYALLVASIETISNSDYFFKFEDKRVWADYDKSPNWEKFFKEKKIEADLQEQIRTQILDLEHMPTKRFKKFVFDKLGQSFWQDADPDLLYELHYNEMIFSTYQKASEAGININPNSSLRMEAPGSWHLKKKIEEKDNPTETQVKRIISNAYDLRSKLLHMGTRFDEKVRGNDGRIKPFYTFLETGEPKWKEKQIVADFVLMRRIAYVCTLNAIMNEADTKG